MEFVIRQSKINEHKDIKDCVNNAFQKYISVLGGRPSAIDTDFVPLIEKGQMYVAAYNNIIAATMVIIKKKDHFLLKNVAVDNQFQKRGLGKKLLNFAEKMTLDNDVPVLQIYTNAALPELVSYWSKMGFQEAKRIRKGGHVIVYMSKKLNH